MQKCNIYNCNIYVAQKYIKHKWIPIIIYLLERDKEMTFSQLLDQIEFISNKRLSTSLKELIDNNLIIKQEDNKYSLIGEGHQLARIIKLMSQFTGEYN